MTDKKQPVGHNCTNCVDVVELATKIEQAEAFLFYAVRNRLRNSASLLPDGAFDLSAHVRAGQALN